MTSKAIYMSKTTVNSFTSLLAPGLEINLRCDYHDGDVTDMPPGYTSTWRSLPWIVVSQVLNEEQHLEFGDGRLWLIQPREAVCVSSGVRHNFENRSPGTNVSRWCHVNLFVGEGVNAAGLFDLTARFEGERARRLGDICELLAARREDSSLAGLARRRALEFELMSILLESAPEVRPAGFWREMERLAPVLSYIEANLEKPLSRPELARRAHLSPSRFAGVFKEALGLAPREYVLQLQLRRAQRLLLTTDLPVTAVAERCGHGDPFHFSRVFKKHVGASPARYREKVKRGP